MRRLEADLLVIGGGLAGAVAALAARAAGARVVLARRAPGATALSSGAISVASDRDALPGDPPRARRAWPEAARRLAARRPGHPYALLGVAALEEAIAFAAAELAPLLEPPDGRDRLLLDAAGRVHACALCQRSQAAGDLARVAGVAAVVGLSGHLGFDARLVASAVAAGPGGGWRPALIAVEAEAFGAAGDGALRPFELARALEAPGAAEALGEAIRRALPVGAAVAILPPVLGIDPAARVAERAAAAAGVPVAEALAGAPSVPGLRLDAALLARLRAVGVEVLLGEVAPGSAPGEVARAGDAEIVAPAWLLATGRFVGGGIVRDGALREPLLGLPVRVPGAGGEGEEWAGAPAALAARPPQSLTGRRWSERQPLLAAGIAIDGMGRPLGADGRPVHERLFAAGAVIGGHELAADGTGLGEAILSGWVAGRGAIGAVRSQ